MENVGLRLEIIILVPASIILITLMAVSLYLWWRKDLNVGLVIGSAAPVGLVTVALTIATLFPFNPRYWNEYQISGNITSVTNTWDQNSGSVSATPVITLDTYNNPLMLNDERAASLNGEDVTLMCSPNWTFRGEDQYVCRVKEVHHP